MEDAVAAVAALQRQLRPAGVVAIPLDPQPLEVGHAPDSVSHEHVHSGRIGDGPSHGQRVGGVELRGIVGADRGRDPALRHERVRRLERALGDERRVGAAGGGFERGVEPCQPGPDDQDVGAMRRSIAHGAAHISRSD
jgi:hypothetical protein